ncbi:Crp/Fnr family transcriptional regulator [Sphingomonas prati]|uniref:CRP-like cAMP-binding protein n=1 Tax=Sphingomonas prati TaxID=1843237 RepID=A0A7W9BSP5_9SPHN|nr:Crp/Fnr family transcriptional regulator [Sphingomonas prati]MBB5728903.1 CRP-like cAMP-binding protein [Sphingomonas prati]GGE86654.1 Crp/Fnr family transcriptional regulator [Sphingomonas prati]
MADILIRKLSRWVKFDAAERAALAKLAVASRPVVRGQHLIREGDDPTHVFLILDGWAQRYKVLPDGKRQIVAFLMPGDLCDTHVFILEKMDHSISMMSPGKVVSIPADDMLAIINAFPRIAQALWWCTLVDEGILREWLVNIGTREAYSRIAHLFCELYVRAGAVARGGNGDFFMPLTQADVGEALGLTAIHVNRTIKALKQSGLVDPAKSRLRMLDFDALKAVGGFDEAYLHARLVPIHD